MEGELGSCCEQVEEERVRLVVKDLEIAKEAGG